MLKWAKRIIKKTARKIAADGGKRSRWSDSTETTRLTSAQWVNATDTLINTDLESSLDTLRTRATYEASCNAYIDGMIGTHQTSILGPNGPTLDVQSDSKAYNEALKAAWGEWWEMPDRAGRLTGVDILRLWLRGLLVNGEFLAQIVTYSAATTRCKARLHLLSPRRLMTPLGQVSDPKIVMGVEIDDYNMAVAYHIDETPDTGSIGTFAQTITRFPAENIIHGYHTLEEGQLRGVPRLAPVLQAVSDIRAFDAETLEAARQAAKFSAVLTNPNSADDALQDPGDAIDVERGQLDFIPPGWALNQLTPTQPSARYVEFRDERLREVGLVVNMPLMTLKRDGSGHSYSSARVDVQGYARSNAAERTWLGGVLDRLANIVASEVGLQTGFPARPDDVTYRWSFAPQPHVDPLKEAKAATERLLNGTTTLQDECMALNKDHEDVIKQQGEEADLRKDAGLPSLLDVLGKGDTDTEDTEDDEQTQATTEQTQQAGGDD